MMMRDIDDDRMATVGMPPSCKHGSWVCIEFSCVVERMSIDRAFVEWVAHYAAMHGDCTLESTCDEAAGGLTDVSVLRAMVESDPKLQAWCLR